MGPILCSEKLHLSVRGRLILSGTLVMVLSFAAARKLRQRGAPALILALAPLALISGCSALISANEPQLQPQAQVQVVDRGPRGTSVGAGGAIANLSSDQLRFFNDGAARFIHPEAVVNGLGPTFNADSCGACHSQPAIGGTSPHVGAFPSNIGPNPQVALATANGAMNKLPFFVTSDGPVREARFKFVVDPDGSIDRNEPDGGVHDLFTIQGRADATNVMMPSGQTQTCVLAQEDFDRARDQNNLTLRIPTPVFGGGLIEMIDDATILTNMQANGAAKRQLGIRGTPNRSGNDGTITRFGWKAQNKSLIMFSHEAYSVEIGETNQMFPQKRGFGGNPPPASCVFNSLPEDQTNLLPASSDTVGVPSDDDAFATFMRFLDQPKPSTTEPGGAPSIANGRQNFINVGCALCHTPAMTTGNSSFTPSPDGKSTFGLSFVQANLFSDLLLHHMGEGLNDGISQGNAGPDQFRTAPLWGVGQRVFFLHDGRTSDLMEAIKQHASSGSEANGVIRRFNRLRDSEKQDLINFLRSL
jgi:CxxC motif-containing protein (DUF1111 family)